MVQLATQLGVSVIAEGVETETEMLVAKEMGCHLIQGYYVQRPSLVSEDILPQYMHVRQASKADRRTRSNKKQIKAYIERVNPIYTRDKMAVVLERFKKNDDIALPVISKDKVPLGILDEEHLRKLVSTPYGHALLLNEPVNEPKVKKLSLIHI